MEEPERFSDLPRGVQVQLATGGPLLLGAVAGLVLVHGATVYWILQAVAALGGIAAGTEHDGARAGAIRGVLGGFLFGLGIVVAFEATGDDATVKIPDPSVVLIVVTTIAGALLGALGGVHGGRARRRPSGTGF